MTSLTVKKTHSKVKESCMDKGNLFLKVQDGPSVSFLVQKQEFTLSIFYIQWEIEEIQLIKTCLVP